MHNKSIHIIGAGAAGLFLALALVDEGFEVNIYDQQNAAARKFLVAGDGGLNLTHSEPSESFAARYTPFNFIKKAFIEYDNRYFIDWLEKHEIPLFTGTSGRVFPTKGIRPAQVLAKLLSYLERDSIHFHYRHQWQGFDDKGNILFKHQEQLLQITPDVTIFALGGASWPVTGSKGDWLHYFAKYGIQVSDFTASNCRFITKLSGDFLALQAGKPLKNIGLTISEKNSIGEIVFNKEGIEGSGIYPFSPQIRAALNQFGKAELLIDLKPHNTKEDLLSNLNNMPKNGSWSERIKLSLRLDATSHRLLKEICSKEEYLNAELLVQKIKVLPIIITGMGPLDEAISSVGGIALNEVDENFQLLKKSDTYIIGEMLDYDAPTGGYLLQSCFSMAMQVAAHLKTRGF